MSFDANDPRWTAYVLGELPDNERAELEQILKSDAAAREFVESLGSTADRLSAELEGQPVPSLSDIQRKRIEKIAAAPRVSRSRSVILALTGCTAAAAVAMGLVVSRQAERPQTARAAVSSSASSGEPTSQTTPVAGGRFALEPNLARPAGELSLNHMPPPPPEPGQGLRWRNKNGLVEQPNTEQYDKIDDNKFVDVSQDARSTFSIDVDTASYSNVRRHLRQGRLPSAGAVRIEEMINYFSYDYAPPRDERPFAIHFEATRAPWKPEHTLLRIGLKGKEPLRERRPRANLVFLIDVSGSMTSDNKLPLLKQAMAMLVDNLDEEDRVAIVVYAGAAGVVLDSTAVASKRKIARALARLQSGGSTNGGAGIRRAYDIATANFVESGINRVILATDGDFNVGTTNRSDLIELVEERARSNVFLTVLGFGMGNYKDATLEQIADRGNGHYAYIDTINEAKKVLVDELDATLVTIAKDVKIQIEFNPARVGHYRLIGYENRVMAHRDFNDDHKDAGEIGAGHTVTALYELSPPGMKVDESTDTDALKYQKAKELSADADSTDLATIKLRYKAPEAQKSQLIERVVTDNVVSLDAASEDSRFAAAAAAFGMLLRNSAYVGEYTYADVLRLARRSLGADTHGYRAELLELVELAKKAR